MIPGRRCPESIQRIEEEEKQDKVQEQEEQDVASLYE